MGRPLTGRALLAAALVLMFSRLTSCIELITTADAVTSEPACGMEDKRGLWYGQFELRMTDSEISEFDHQAWIRFKEGGGMPEANFCNINMQVCQERVPTYDPISCYCRSNTNVPGEPGVRRFRFYMQKKPLVEDSNRRIEIVIQHSTKKELSEVIDMGRAPTVYKPLKAKYRLDNFPEVTLNDSSKPIKVIAQNSKRPQIVFSVDNLLLPYTLSVELSGVRRSSSNRPVGIQGAFDWSLSRSYDVKYIFRETAGCQRTNTYVGTVCANATACQPSPSLPSEEVTKAKKADKFKNLETIYIVMLLSMAAIFLIACVIGYIWYRQQVDQIKSFREQELQGAMDFDPKFDLRGSKIDLETSSRSSKRGSQRMDFTPQTLRMGPMTPNVESGYISEPPRAPPTYEQSQLVKGGEAETSNDAMMESNTTIDPVSPNSTNDNNNDSLNSTKIAAPSSDVDLPSESDSDEESTTQSFKVDLHPISEELETDVGCQLGHINIELRDKPTTASTNNLNESNCSDI